MRISDWSSDVCSSDLITGKRIRAVRGCADASLHREVLALHHVAVQRDLDLVAAGREAVGLGDVELGVAGAGQVDRLAFLIDDLAVLERPRRLQGAGYRSEEHTSELQSLMRISYAVFCSKKN